MSNSSRVVMAAVVCIYVVAFSHHVDSANNCEPVLEALAPCESYLKQGGSVPDSCCDGMKSINAAATTTAIRRSYCECLQSEGKSLGVSEKYASSLPAKCSVKVNYPISYKLNCNSIH